MKPIPSDVSNEVIVTLHKAKRLLQKAEKLEMIEHGGKKVPAFAADGKGAKDMKSKADMATKDKYCMKNFGKKYSECSEKQIKARCASNVNLAGTRGACPRTQRAASALQPERPLLRREIPWAP